MPITENNFSPEEFASAIEANPELISHATAAIKSKGFFVRSQEEETSYNANLEQTISASHTKRTAEMLEKSVKEITGIDKSPDEKYYDYAARALKTLKESGSSLQAQIDDLKGKTDLSAAEREKLTKLESLVSEKDKMIGETKNSYEKRIAELSAENHISIEIAGSGLKFNPLIPQGVIDVMHKKAISEMKSSAYFDEALGKFVFKGEDGKVMLNSQDGSILTAKDVYNLKMADVLEKARTQGGAGSEQGGGNSSGKTAKASSKAELINKLNEMGLVSFTPEFNKAFKESGGDALPEF